MNKKLKDGVYKTQNGNDKIISPQFYTDPGKEETKVDNRVMGSEFLGFVHQALPIVTSASADRVFKLSMMIRGVSGRFA